MIASDAPQLDGLTFVRPLGSGGYANVYLYEVRQPRLQVAVKVVEQEHLTSDMLDQVMGEAHAMAELSHHPHIAQVHRADVTADGRPYIVMKYYPGDTYAVRVRTAPFPVAEVLRAGVQIACAVETAHRAGILHRDIKPANILTDQYAIPALTDFGIAVVADQTRSDAEGMSLPWAPPETVFSTSAPDGASDIYSLGATLWHLLVGRSPFDVPGDNSTGALMRRIQQAQPPATRRGDVPGSLERLLATCMAKQPTDRPSSALELARALRAIEQEQQLPLTPLTLLEDVAPRRAARTEGADETRVRTPQTVAAQPIRETPSRRERERVMPEPVALDATMERPRAVEERAPEPTPSPPAGKRRVVAVAAVAAAVVAAVVIGVVLSSGGNPHAAAPPERVVRQSVGLTASPGTPIVHASAPVRKGASSLVTFHWRGYANELNTDTFVWRRSGSVAAAHGTSTAPSLRVAVARGKTACLSVQVIRNDGSSPSEFSDPVCAP